MRAGVEARKNLSENYFRCGDPEQAVDASHIGFLQCCARASSTLVGSKIRRACADRVDDCLSHLLALLENVNAPNETIEFAHKISMEAKSSFYALEEAC